MTAREQRREFWDHPLPAIPLSVRAAQEPAPGALIPLAFTVTRYRCPCCPRTGSSRQRMAAHIGRCWHNPANRACKTCAHYLPAEGGSPEGPPHPPSCLTGIDISDDQVRTDCAAWRLETDDR